MDWEQLDRVGDVPDQIAAVMSVFFTSAQRAKIAKKVTVRREECKTALVWAIKNNIYAEGVTADDILASSPDPVLIDHSTEVESRDPNTRSPALTSPISVLWGGKCSQRLSNSM